MSAGLSVGSTAKAQDFGKLDLTRVGTGASENGVVMLADADSVYIYDSGKDRAIVISKHNKVSADGDLLVPQTVVINTKTMTASQVLPAKK